MGFILFHKINYWELDSNTIIFMKNHINIESSRIIEISEVNNGRIKKIAIRECAL